MTIRRDFLAAGIALPLLAMAGHLPPENMLLFERVVNAVLRWFAVT